MYTNSKYWQKRIRSNRNFTGKPVDYIERITRTKVKKLNALAKTELYNMVHLHDPEMVVKLNLAHELMTSPEEMKAPAKASGREDPLMNAAAPKEGQAKETKVDKVISKGKKGRSINWGDSVSEIIDNLINSERVGKAGYIHPSEIDPEDLKRIAACMLHKKRNDYSCEQVAEHSKGPMMYLFYRGQYYGKYESYIARAEQFCKDFDESRRKIAEAVEKNDGNFLLQPLCKLIPGLKKSQALELQDYQIVTIWDYLRYRKDLPPDKHFVRLKSKIDNIVEEFKLHELDKNVSGGEGAAQIDQLVFKISGSREDRLNFMNLMIRQAVFSDSPVDVEIKSVPSFETKAKTPDSDEWTYRSSIVTSQRTGNVSERTFKSAKALGRFLIDTGQEIQRIGSVSNFIKSNLFFLK